MLCFARAGWLVKHIATSILSSLFPSLSLGAILSVMQHAVIGIDEEDESTFTISAGNQTYHFQGSEPSADCSEHTLHMCTPFPSPSSSPPLSLPGQSSEEKDTWVQVLNDTIRQLQKPKPPVSATEGEEGKEGEGRRGQREGKSGEGREGRRVRYIYMCT